MILSFSFYSYLGNKKPKKTQKASIGAPFSYHFNIVLILIIKKCKYDSICLYKKPFYLHATNNVADVCTCFLFFIEVLCNAVFLYP